MRNLLAKNVNPVVDRVFVALSNRWCCLKAHPERGEGMVGWIIIVAAVAVVALWAVGVFKTEVEAKMTGFNMNSASGGSQP